MESLLHERVFVHARQRTVADIADIGIDVSSFYIYWIILNDTLFQGINIHLQGINITTLRSTDLHLNTSSRNKHTIPRDRHPLYQSHDRRHSQDR